MGVMQCSRPSCENIMCDTYVNSVGYVCNSCQSEFKDYVESEGLDVSSEGKIERALKGFMNTDKDSLLKVKKLVLTNFLINIQEIKFIERV